MPETRFSSGIPGVSIGPRAGIAFGGWLAEWMCCVSAQAKHLQEHKSYPHLLKWYPRQKQLHLGLEFYFNRRKIIFPPQLF